jgi:hypothetical protein
VTAASLATSPQWQPRSPRGTSPAAQLAAQQALGDAIDPAVAAHAVALAALRDALALTRDQQWRGPRPTTRKLVRVVELKRRLDASLDEAAFRQRIEVFFLLDYREPTCLIIFFCHSLENRLHMYSIIKSRHDGIGKRC